VRFAWCRITATAISRSNEITAIPKLLEILEFTGAIVTILHEATKDEFSKHLENDFTDVDCRQHHTSEQAHGRVEERTYYQMKLPANFPNRDEWQPSSGIKACLTNACTGGRGGILS
jgi:hypothetical protein